MNPEAEEELYSGLRTQDLQEAKDQLLVSRSVSSSSSPSLASSLSSSSSRITRGQESTSGERQQFHHPYHLFLSLQHFNQHPTERRRQITWLLDYLNNWLWSPDYLNTWLLDYHYLITFQVETADMLHTPLFTAEALLRDSEWSREVQTFTEIWSLCETGDKMWYEICVEQIGVK